MLTLFHSPQTRSSRLIWLLEEIGLPYEIRYVDIVRRDGGASDPGNPHPEQKVPALAHNGEVVTESAAIALYIAELAPEKGLAPPPGDPYRGPFLTWLFYYAGVMEAVITAQFGGFIDNDDFIRTFRGREAMDARILAALDAHDYLAGPNFTAADVLIATLGMWARQLLPAGPVVDAYLARCAARPALARAASKDAKPAAA